MRWTFHWQKEDGPRLEGARALDRLKVLTPCVVRNPAGGFRMFYTGLGLGKPFATCQGYILSATSRDGLRFQVEPGIRLAPQPELEHMSLRALAPSVTPRKRGGWRMYFEARGPADQPSVICSAVSQDMLRWELEEGIRLWTPGGVRAPRYLQLPDGRGRMYLCGSEYGPGGPATGKRLSQGVLSAISHDGVDFEFEPEYRLRSGAGTHDSSGFSAAEVVSPSENAGDNGHIWTMFGWTLHTTSNTNPRSVRNFPMQGNGAEMLRLACIKATENGVRVCAPVHDALLVEGPLSELDAVITRTREAMAWASTTVLDGFELRTDVTRFDHPQRYADPRGQRMWEIVMRILDEQDMGAA